MVGHVIGTPGSLAKPIIEMEVSFFYSSGFSARRKESKLNSYAKTKSSWSTLASRHWAGESNLSLVIQQPWC